MSYTILLAEDNPDSRDALTLLLELEGFQVIGAVDGIDALEIAENNPVDLLITDISMPRMSGIELTRKLSSENLKLPIIAITAASEQARFGVLNAGAAVCMAKPIDIAALLQSIYSLLSYKFNIASEIA
jgi:DNA-binding response OmpR family regulator